MDQVTDLENTGPENTRPSVGDGKRCTGKRRTTRSGVENVRLEKRALLKNEITGLEMAGRVQLIRITDSNKLIN